MQELMFLRLKSTNRLLDKVYRITRLSKVASIATSEKLCKPASLSILITYIPETRTCVACSMDVTAICSGCSDE